MTELPAPIRDFILALTDETLSPGYMLLKDEGALLEWGGNLEAYGIKDLKRYMNAAEHVSFLIGLLPLDSSSVFLPHVQVTPDVFADVYLFEREQGVWVLLLDSTANTEKKLKMQQKLYDSRLQVEDLAREGDALYKANAVLEELVRERTAELTNTILRLKQELEERHKVEKKLLEKEARNQAS